MCAYARDTKVDSGSIQQGAYWRPAHIHEDIHSMTGSIMFYAYESQAAYAAGNGPITGGDAQKQYPISKEQFIELQAMTMAQLLGAGDLGAMTMKQMRGTFIYGIANQTKDTPFYDAEGDPVMEDELDESGAQVLDAGGNPKQKQVMVSFFHDSEFV